MTVKKRKYRASSTVFIEIWTTKIYKFLLPAFVGVTAFIENETKINGRGSQINLS